MAAEQVETRFLMTAQDRASAVMKSMRSEMERVQGAVGGVKLAFTALAAAAPIAALAAKVTSSANLADSLLKLSQRSGIAVESLSALRYQAELSDVSFEDLQTGLKKFNVAIADAAAGGKEQIALFKALGLSQDDIQSGLSDTEGLLRKVADRFSRFEDGAAKTALAVDLFGKSGDRMIVMLNEGAKGFDAARRELERFGGIVGKDFAEKSQAFNDNLTRLKFLSEASAISIGSKLVPALNSMLEELLKGREIAGGYFKALMLFGSINPFRTLGENIAAANREIETLIANQARALQQGRAGAAGAFTPAIEAARRQKEFLQFQQRREALDRFKPEETFDQNDRRSQRAAGARQQLKLEAKGAGGANEGATFLESLQRRIAALSENEFGLLRIEAAQKKVAQSAEPLIARYEREKTFLDELTRARQADEQAQAAEISRRQALVTSVADFVQATEEETAAMRLSNEERLVQQQLLKLQAAGIAQTSAEFVAAAKRIRGVVFANAGAKAFEETRTPMELLNRELARLQTLLDEGAINWDTYARKVFEAEEKFNGTAEAIDKTKSAAEELGLTFSSALEGGLQPGAKVRDLLRGIEQDILRIGTRKLVTEPIAKKLTGLFEGGGEGIGEFLSSIFGSIFGGARASGGPIFPGKLHLVGERGPELVSFDRPGHVTPNSMLRSVGMSAPITINVNMPPNVSRETSMEAAARVGQAVQIALRRNR